MVGLFPVNLTQSFELSVVYVLEWFLDNSTLTLLFNQYVKWDEANNDVMLFEVDKVHATDFTLNRRYIYI